MRDREREVLVEEDNSPTGRLRRLIISRKEKVERKSALGISISRIDNDIVSIDQEIKGILDSHFTKRVPKEEPSGGA